MARVVGVGRWQFVAWVVAWGAVGSGSVRAQSDGGWALDRYEPSPAGDTFFSGETPWYGDDSTTVRGGLILDYARDPLVIRGARGSGVDTHVVENMLVGHLQLGLGLTDRIGVHLSLPVSLWQSGDAAPAANLEPGNFTVGDPRVGVRVRLFGDADEDAVSLHAGAMLFMPAGLFGVARANNTTDDRFRFKANLTLAGHPGSVVWSAAVGFHFRPKTFDTGTTAVSSDVFLNAALGYVTASDRLTLSAELWAATTTTNAFEWKHVNSELVLGAHYRIADVFLLGVGAGPGLSQGAGTPLVRALVQLMYAPNQEPPPPDRDRDGVLDADDQCIDEPQGESPDPQMLGCPLRDRDGDGVFDRDDICPDEPKGEHPDAERLGCPVGDRDGDGILDDTDECIDVPEGDHPDPARSGCPDGDDDGDGVLNAQDECRTQAKDPFPNPERLGCPLPDRDGDSVPEPPDACPDQPGAPSRDPARNGCPGLVALSEGFLRIVEPVYFATNRDVILARSEPVLMAVAEALLSSPHIRRVAVEGHTDDVNDDAYNLELSQRRADSVMRWLVAHGVEPERLEAHGFGESQPAQSIEGLRSRALRDARAANRRVAFRIVDPALPSGLEGQVQ